MAPLTTTAWPGGPGATAHRAPRLVVTDHGPGPGTARTAVTPGDARSRYAHHELGATARPAAAARRAVREHCTGRVPDDVIEDLRLVVSELVANVLEHGDGAVGLTLDLAIRATEVDVQVTGHGDRRQLPPRDEWCLPPATQCSGRGLAVVRRLARWVAVDGDDAVREHSGWIAIVASVPYA